MYTHVHVPAPMVASDVLTPAPGFPIGGLTHSLRHPVTATQTVGDGDTKAKSRRLKQGGPTWWTGPHYNCARSTRTPWSWKKPHKGADTSGLYPLAAAQPPHLRTWAYWPLQPRGKASHLDPQPIVPPKTCHSPREPHLMGR